MKRGLQKVSGLLPGGLSRPSCFTLGYMIDHDLITCFYLKSRPVLQAQIFKTQDRIRRKQIRKMVVQVHLFICRHQTSLFWPLFLLHWSAFGVELMRFVFLMKLELRDATDSLDVFLWRDAVSFQGS